MGFLLDSFPLGDYSSSLSFFLYSNTQAKHTLPYTHSRVILLLEIKICFLNLPEAKVLLLLSSQSIKNLQH